MAHQPRCLHIVGSPGSGKSTLVQVMLTNLIQPNILALDASKNGQLLGLLNVRTQHSLAHVIQQLKSSPMNRESLDWALHDLPQPLGIGNPESDVVSLGAIPLPLGAYELALLSYGLPRLCKNYELILWDGSWQGLRGCLSPISVQDIVVITPHDNDFCRDLAEGSSSDPLWLVLSKAEKTDTLPDIAQQYVQQGLWHFVGKIPPLDNQAVPDEIIKEHLKDCVYRLDFPVTWLSNF